MGTIRKGQGQEAYEPFGGDTHLQVAGPRRLESYHAITAATYTYPQLDGRRETTYNYVQIAMPSYRIVPVLLGTDEDPCDHRPCLFVASVELMGDYLKAAGETTDDDLAAVSEMVRDRIEPRC